MKICTTVLFLFLYSQQIFATCLHNRAVIEYGSGSTKAIVAKVNTCANPWTYQAIARTSESIQYRNNTSLINGLRMLSNKVMQEGTVATQKILNYINKYNVESVIGIATSVFRDQAADKNGTLNGRIFLNKLSEKFHFKIHILSQRDEGTLAAEAAISEVSKKVPNFQREKAIVWDIGGGSMQLVLPSTQQGQYDDIFLGEFGSATMQEYVNVALKNHYENITSSANPVSVHQAQQLYQYIESSISPQLAPKLRKKIMNRYILIGIGGVHKYSNCELIYGNGATLCNYTDNDLNSSINELAGLTDQELYQKNRCSVFKYCRDKITNAVLVSALMHTFQQKVVMTANSSAKDGILVSPSFW